MTGNEVTERENSEAQEIRRKTRKRRRRMKKVEKETKNCCITWTWRGREGDGETRDALGRDGYREKKRRDQ